MPGSALLFTAVVAMMAGPKVELRDRSVRMSDVAVLPGLGLAAHPRFASRVIATVPPGRTRMSMTRAALNGLVRRAVPGLAGEVVADGKTITFHVPSFQAPLRRGDCYETSQPVADGAALKASDIMSAPCEPTVGGEAKAGSEREAASVRFDRRATAVRATAPLAAGTRLGRLALPVAPDVDRGDTLTLVSTVGPVTVERKVVALQAGRSGGRIFVLDTDGQVLAAPLASIATPDEIR